MATMIDRIRGVFGTRDRVKPFTEQGAPGFAVYGGYIVKPESNNDVLGPNRWRVASDLLANVSIIAASLRQTLNLISNPKWSFEPADDSDEAKVAAEFMEDVFGDIDESWTRIVRRAGMYRYHGFGIHEWIAKKRDDGRIGIKSIESRPQHTIQRWDIDDTGNIAGVWQRDPQNGAELYLPRAKQFYIVDDTLTDSPDGIGWFRHLAEPANRLKSYLELEGIGFERDLGGIPVGRAPIQRINELVEAGRLTAAQRTQMLNGLNEFVKMKRKSSETGLVLDSTTYKGKSDTGESVSSVYEWGMELITGSQNSIQELGDAVRRLQFDMALIMGTESMLVGREGAGSQALSKDKSRNMYLTANATLADMAECADRDLVSPLWLMNGLDEKLKPKCKVEDVSPKDVEPIAQVLADMANAGAILAPDDPAINDLRDLMGLSRADPMDMGMLNALRGRSDPTKPDPNAPDPSVIDPNAPPGSGGKAGPPGKAPGADKARKSETNSLYVMRPLLNADAVIEWAKAQGFAVTVPPEEMHVTVAFSRQPVDWSAAGDSFDHLRDSGGKRSVVPLGDKDAVVLKFDLPELTDRWQQFRDIGASWDFPGYQAHVTITYQGSALDLAKIEPYDGPLEFGPEVFSPVVDDWEKGLAEKTFDPGQARHPKGTPLGGQWLDVGTGGPSVMFEVAPNPDDKKLTERWNSLSDEQKQAITKEVAADVTPKVLEHLGVKGTLVDSIGGFEGAINPSLELRFDGAGAEMAAASILGSGLSQKSMVVASATPMAGLGPVGGAAIHLPPAARNMQGARDTWSKISGIEGVDGFTLRNNQMEILNFTGRSTDAFVKDIDSALGGGYTTKQAQIYSTLLEAPDYDNHQGKRGGVSGLQVSDSLRQSVQSSLEEKLRSFGKRLGEAEGQAESLKYAPGQARNPKGPGGGQFRNEAQPLTKEAEQKLKDGQKGHTLEELYAMAKENQVALGKTGDQLAKELGVDFRNPGVKKFANAQEKIGRKGYKGPHEMTDLARASFIIDRPADAEKTIAALAKGAKVYDQGWNKMPRTAYLDRKVLIQHPNGGVGEVQIVPRGIYQVKHGGGHALYTLARSAINPRGEAKMVADMKALYTNAIAGTEFEGLGE